MYSFDPTEEQQMLVGAIQRYAANDLRPKMRDADEDAALQPRLVSKGWELGLLQASIPEQYGGFGERSAVTGLLAAEELAYGDLAAGLAVMTPNLFALPLLLCGSEEQKMRYLPGITAGDWAPYTAALIEPRLEFDPNDLRTLAVEDGKNYLLTGEKTFVPYAQEAEAILVYARKTGRTATLDGRTQGFIVPKGTPGLVIGERQKTLGIRAVPLYPVSFKDVLIPQNNRLGGHTGHDFEPLLAGMRLALTGLALGMSRAALDYAIDYAKGREVFGVKVAQKQAVAFMLAEMAVEIEAQRLLAWEAAWKLDTGASDAAKDAYLALTGAADMAMMVGDRAVQVLGGHGYIREYPVELWMRNARGIAMLNGLAMI